MAIIESLHFEEADIDTFCTDQGYTKSGAIVLSTAQKYAGTKSIKCDYLGYVRKIYPDPYVPKSFFRLMFYVESYPAYWTRFIIGGITNQGWQWIAELQTDGKIRFNSPGIMGADASLYTANAISLNTWHELFMRITTEDNICQCIIDRETLTNNSAKTDGFTQGIWNQNLGNGDNANNNDGVIYIDEFERNDSEYPPSLSPPTLHTNIAGANIRHMYSR
jgi:hypothetical protein